MNATPPAPPARYKCPFCEVVHIPSHCNRYGACGCCWAIKWMNTEPEPPPF